jgi:hypothetical protein
MDRWDIRDSASALRDAAENPEVAVDIIKERNRMAADANRN